MKNMLYLVILRYLGIVSIWYQKLYIKIFKVILRANKKLLLRAPFELLVIA